MKHKFEIGDRVRIKDKDVAGEIISVSKSEDVYLVRFDGIGTSFPFPEHKLEFENPKLAFLTRLQELLATFDAVINVSWNDGWQEDDAKCPLCDLDVILKGGKYITYDNILDRTITAKNVFDYDKE